MKSLKSTITLIILTLFIGACAKPPSQFYDSFPERISIADQVLFSKAIEHQKKGQIKSAISLWEKFLGKYPNSYEARNNIGFLYYANDQITQAIVQFEQGLKLESGSVKIRGNLLRALKVKVSTLEENKEYDEAIINLKRISQLSPTKEQEKIDRQVEGLEDKIFKQVKNSDLREEYQTFLEKYPNSPQNSDEARLWIQESQRIETIKQKGQSPTPELFSTEAVPGVRSSGADESTEAVGEPHKSIDKSTAVFPVKIVEVTKPKAINVHSEPKIESDNIVHRLETGTQVIYADENRGWYQVEFANGKKGWVIKKYTKLLE